MNSIDEDGRLLLHHATCDNRASLGAIKLIVKANPTAALVRDSNELLPIHLACCLSTSDVVQYLVELDQSVLEDRDDSGNNLLHIACKMGNCGAIKYLSQTSLVSTENNDGLLPIHLLCARSGEQESTEYTESIWRLLVAHPETVSRG